jgi:hypothetical protein
MVQLIVRACDEAFPLFEPFALFLGALQSAGHDRIQAAIG